MARQLLLERGGSIASKGTRVFYRCTLSPSILACQRQARRLRTSNMCELDAKPDT